MACNETITYHHFTSVIQGTSKITQREINLGVLGLSLDLLTQSHWVGPGHLHFLLAPQ